MARSPSKTEINRALRRLQKNNPGVTFRVIRASNGEVAIIPTTTLERVSPCSKSPSP